MELIYLVGLLGTSFVLGVFFGLTITLFLVYFPKVTKFFEVMQFIYEYKKQSLEEKKEQDKTKKKT